MIKWSREEAIKHIVELRDPLDTILSQNGTGLSNVLEQLKAKAQATRPAVTGMRTPQVGMR